MDFRPFFEVHYLIFVKIQKSTIVNYLKEVHDKFDGFHNIIHIGGDEVPHDGATVIWESSPICQKFIQEVCYLIFQKFETDIGDEFCR